ncbi:MAG: response regulator transcription factor [Acidobacteria bacterium]|nr:response regulator transcription factor [Acidobacteriota bacterium]
MSSILIVEDEQHLAHGLRFNLQAEGYEVTLTDTGEEALEILRRDPGRFALVVLDVMLPARDGFSVAAELRQSGNFVPVLMLTARGRPDDVLKGFESGADDYMAKPFELPILIARIKGLLLRHKRMLGSSRAPTPPDVFTFGDRTIDFEAKELRAGGKVVPLTLMETNLLRHLVWHQHRPVSRKTILEDVWGVREDTDTRAIDNFIVRLRKYIEPEPSKPRHLLTVRGVGYKFDPEGRR